MKEQQLQQQLRRLFAASEPDGRDTPTFRATLRAARGRLDAQGAQPTPWMHSGWAVVAASVAAVAVVAVLAMRPFGPSLQDDIRLAQSLSFESVWRSPSDRLLAESMPSLLRDTPAMPRAGEPRFSTPIAKEYL